MIIVHPGTFTRPYRAVAEDPYCPRGKAFVIGWSLRCGVTGTSRRRWPIGFNWWRLLKKNNHPGDPMSLLTDFEKRELRLDYGKSLTVRHYGVLDVQELLDHARALEFQNESLRTMLKKHEWADDSDCPECGGGNPEVAGRLLGTLSEYGPEHYRGHASNCALARLLEGVEASD